MKSAGATGTELSRPTDGFAPWCSGYAAELITINKLHITERSACESARKQSDYVTITDRRNSNVSVRRTSG